MNAPSEDIKDMLVADTNLSLVFATDLFIGRVPTQPDNCAIIIDTVGGPAEVAYQKGEDYFYSNIQIIVRNNSYKAGYALAKDIMTSLHNRAGETWNGTFYTVIYCTGEPFFQDSDENNRTQFFINFHLQRR